MPLVSVVITTFNRSQTLARAISSVLAQTFLDYEIIVVDDGSTDETAGILADFGSAINVVTQKNKGVSAARNAGISRGYGELFAFLDSDDEWMPHKLELQVAGYRAGAPFICHTNEIWMKEGKRLNQKKKHRKQGGYFFERALDLCLISPSSVMISKRLFTEVGLFDENLPAAEDYDLWLRITPFHYVEFIDVPLVIKHAGAPNQLSVTTPVIDKYRIQAILKILANHGLKPEYKAAALNALKRKCGIVTAGYLKRGKKEAAEVFRGLAKSDTTDYP